MEDAFNLSILTLPRHVPPLSSYTHDALTMAYRIRGSGPMPVVAFHGFGRSGADFAFLESFIGEACTVYAFDLPFHGESPSPAERAEEPFTPEEWAAFFAAFADHIGAERIVLLGYSLGGRLALSLLERIPGRICKAFLLAPDGLKQRPWYRGLAGSAIGRRLYAHFVGHPGLVHGLVHGLRAVRLMNERLHRFIIGQSDTRAKRELLRDTWLGFRAIEPDLHRVAAHLREQDIPVQLVFGARDSVIPPTLARKIQPLAPDQVHVHRMDAGHVLLTPELGEWLRGQDWTDGTVLPRGQA